MTASAASSGASRIRRARLVERRHDRRAARLAGQDALLARDPAGHRERVAVGDAHPAVDRGRVEGAREEVLADALGQVGSGGVARQDGALGVGADDPDGGVLGAQVVDRAADRAARPDAGHEVGHAAVRLAPDLGSRRALVGQGVLHVPVLVGLEGARDVAREPRGDRVVALGRLGGHVGGAEHDLRAVGAQQRLLLGRLLVGHDEDAAVALERGRDGQAVAGVAARRLDDGAARLEQPGPLGGLDHGQPDAVLDRAAGVEHLELGQDERLAIGGAEDVQVTRDAGQADERRVARPGRGWTPRSASRPSIGRAPRAAWSAEGVGQPAPVFARARRRLGRAMGFGDGVDGQGLEAGSHRVRRVALVDGWRPLSDASAARSRADRRQDRASGCVDRGRARACRRRRWARWARRMRSAEVADAGRERPGLARRHGRRRARGRARRRRRRRRPRGPPRRGRSKASGPPPGRMGTTPPRRRKQPRGASASAP